LTAFQIISNRAHAICYGVRQQHFRARAELTVSRLMASSEQQLSTLVTISHTQEQLKAVADNTIDQLETGRQQIASDQQQLREAHQTMNSQVLRNLKHIQQEREVIIAGNKQVIAKTEQIQQKLDSTADQISEQTEVQSARHKELLTNLAQLGAQADDVSSKLDASTTLVENFQQDMIKHQLDAIENLKVINDTVNFLLSFLTNIRDVLEVKLEWILLLTGATDSRMAVLSVVAAHISYAVIAGIIFSLLHVKRYICYLLITLILLNAAADLKFNCGFGLTGLAAGLLAVGFVVSSIAWCWIFLLHRSACDESVAESSSGDNPNSHHRLSSEDIRYVITTLEQLSADFTRRISGSDEHKDASISCSTPIRHLPELGRENLSNRKHPVSFPLDCTPPPVRRHLLPSTPQNPPPTPFVFEGSLLNDSVALGLDSGGRSCPNSPAGSASCSGTPRAARLKNRRTGSLNRSFNRTACTAVTKSGQICKLPSQEGSVLCHRHQHNE